MQTQLRDEASQATLRHLTEIRLQRAVEELAAALGAMERLSSEGRPWLPLTRVMRTSPAITTWLIWSLHPQVVTIDQIYRAMRGRSILDSRAVHVALSHARTALDINPFETVRGTGYRMTDEGWEHVRRILHEEA